MSPDSTPPGTCRIEVDGGTVLARAGQTVAAALLDSGLAAWRRTRHTGRPRGVFCGIGVCFDCLVVVNGRPNVRACVTRVADGDVITTQEGTGHDDLAC